jgi:hypothetical protein
MAKAFTLRLSLVARRIISQTQSDFIKRQHIHEEIVHDTKSKKV